MKKIYLILILAFNALVQMTYGQCNTTPAGRVMAGTPTFTYAGTQLVGNSWGHATILPTGFKYVILKDTDYVTGSGSIDNIYYEIYTCGRKNVQIWVENFNYGTLPTTNYKYDLNNYSCGGSDSNEYVMHVGVVEGVKVYFLGDSASSISDTVTVYYRRLCKSPDLQFSWGNKEWIGNVWKWTSSSNYFKENLGTTANQNMNFTMNLDSAAPTLTNACQICPSRISKDSFALSFRMDTIFPRKFYKIVCNTPGDLKLTNGTNTALLDYWTNGSSVNTKQTTRLFIPTTTTDQPSDLYKVPESGHWRLDLKKSTGTLKADFSICQMDGDYTWGIDKWNAYVYDWNNPSYYGNVYQGTFSSDSSTFAYDWGTAQPTINSSTCGVTMDDSSYFTTFLMKKNFQQGRYKIRIRSKQGGNCSLTDRTGVIKYLVSNVAVASTYDITSPYITFSGDTFLSLTVYKYNNGTSRLSFVSCREPKDPGHITVSRDTACVGDQVTLTADTADGTETQWYKKSCAGAGGLYIGSGASITVTMDTSTTFYVRNRNRAYASGDTTNSLDLYSTNCSSKRIIAVPYPSAPTAPTAQSRCSSGSEIFTFSGVNAGTNGNQVQWATSSSFTNGKTIISGGSFNDTVANGHIDTIWIRSKRSDGGCVSSAVTTTATNHANPAPPTAPPSQSVCSDTAYTFVFDSIQVGMGGDSIEWALNPAFTGSHHNGDFGSISVTLDTATIDTIWIRSFNKSTGCLSSPVHFEAEVHPFPKPSITPADTTIIIGQQVTYSLSGGNHYLWENIFDTSAVLTLMPVADTTNYSVSAFSEFGCETVLTAATIVQSHPELLYISYSDTIQSGDTTDVFLYCSLSNTHFSWDRTNLQDVDGLAYDTGNHIRVPLVNQTFSSQKVIFHAHGYSPGYPFMDKDIEVNLGARANTAITLTSANLPSTVTSCATQNFSFDLLQDANATVTLPYAIKISLTVGSVQLAASNVGNIKINGIPIAQATGYSVSLNGNELLITVNAVANPAVNISYDLYLPCSVIPSTPGNAQLQQLIDLVDPSTGTSLATTYSINGGILNQAQTVSVQLLYPYLERTTSSVNLNMFLGQTSPFSIVYQNTSATTAYAGDLALRILFNGCPSGTLDIRNLDIKVNNVSILQNPPIATPFVGQSFEYIPNITVPIGGVLVISGEIQLLTCISSPPGQCNATVEFFWGCPNPNSVYDPSYSCHSTSSTIITVTQSPARPFVVVSRVLPAPPSADGLQRVWDGTCAGAELDEWQYLIINRGTARADNVDIDLNTIAGTYALVDKFYVSIDPADSRFNLTGAQTTNIPSQIGANPNPQLSAASWNSHCITEIQNRGSGHDALSSYHLIIPQMDPGQNVVIHFRTYRCCPSDIAFNTGANFNRWKLDVTYEFCGNQEFANQIPGANFAWLNSSYTMNGQTTPTYLAFASQTYISSQVQDGNPDLALQQQYLPEHLSLVGPPANSCGSPTCCGDGELFRIKNVSFTSATALSDFDTQLFCSSAVTGGNGGITGSNPHGVFKVRWDWNSQGLNMVNDPSISGLGRVWLPVPGSVNIDNVNGFAEALFDIDGPYTDDNATPQALPPFSTSFDFRNFFLSSFDNFWFASCCPNSDASVDVNVKTWFNPLPVTSGSGACISYLDDETNSCLIKMAQVDFNIALHCPGCDAPGVRMDEFDVNRTTLGYQDFQNVGVPDGGGLTSITTGYLQNHPINTHAAIVGDELEVKAHAIFDDGNPAVTFGYNAWQNYWDLLGPRPVITDWYFEQLVDNSLSLGVECIGGTVTYVPASGGQSIPYSLPITTPIQPSSNQTPSNANERFLFHIDVNTAFGSVDIQPGDAFEVAFQYRICGNPSSTTVLSFSDNYMYLSIAPLTASFPYISGSDVESSYTGSSGGQYATFDPSSSAYNQALFYCDAFAQGNLITVYPVISDYSEEWNNPDVCAKQVTIKAGYHIEDNSNGQQVRNVFPFEYRLMPQIDKNNFLIGPALASGTDPIRFHTTIPLGYTATFVSAFTEAIMYHNNVQNAILVSQTTDPSDIIAPTGFSMPANWPNIAAATTSIAFDWQANVSNNGLNYSPPFSNLGYTVPLIFPYPHQTIGNGAPTYWALGDENFAQGITFSIEPICSALTNTSTTISPGDESATIPVYDQPCSGTPANQTLQSAVNHYLTIPSPTLLVTGSSGALQFNGSFVDCTISFHTQGSYQDAAANLHDEYVENLFLLYDVSALNALGVTLVSVTPGGALSPIIPTNVQNSSYAMVPLGFVDNSVHNFVIRFESVDCNNSSINLSVPIQYLWSCDGYPDPTNPNSDFPGLNYCSSPTTIPIQILKPDVATGANLSLEGQIQTCEGIEYKACLSSSAAGGVGELLGSITLPSDLQIETNTVSYTVQSSAGMTQPHFLASSDVHNNGNTWTFDLTSYTPFTSAFAGDDGLNLGEEICITFFVTVPCQKANYTPSIPPIIFNFDGKKFCNETFQISTNTLNNQASPIPNGCGPFVTVTVDNAPCWGPISYIEVNDGPYGSGPCTQVWQPFTPSLTNPGPGIYTLTATDQNGCIDEESVIINTPFFVNETHTASICQGSSYGAISLTNIGGTGPYQYYWNTGAATKDLIQLHTGTYSVTVTDDLGCIVTKSFTISPDNTCCGGGDVYVGGGYNGKLDFKNITSTQLMTALGLSGVMIFPSQHLTFDGDFIIDNNLTILNSPYISFGPGASVIINNGQALQVAGSHLYACDNYLWKGIRVKGKFGILPSAKFGITNSEINDAQYAINPEPKSIISVTNTAFRDNFVGVYFNGGIVKLPGNSLTLLNPFYGNTFWGTNGLKSSFAGMINGYNQPSVAEMDNSLWPWAGLHLDNLNSFNLGFVKYGFHNYSNLFYGLANGVVARNCNLNVLNSYFFFIGENNYSINKNGLDFQGNAILANSYSPGLYGAQHPATSLFVRGFGKYNYSDPTFNMCYKGIVSDYLTLDVQQCFFASSQPWGHTGVRVTHAQRQKILIKDNSITELFHGIQLSQSDPVLQGDINSNNIYVINNNVQNVYGFGIEINESMKAPLKFEKVRNNIIRMSSLAIGGIYVNSSKGSEYYRNQIFLDAPWNNFYGVSFANSEILNHHNYISGSAASVVQNKRVLFGVFVGSDFPAGIYASNSSYSSHTCNTIENIFTGARFALQNLNAGANNLLQGNDFNTSTTPSPALMNVGLLAEKSNVFDNINNAGNRWYGSFSHLSADNRNVYNASVAKLKTATNSGPYHPLTSAPLGWVTVSGTGNTFVCIPEPNIDYHGTGALTSVDETIINGTLSFEESEDELKWQCEKTLYKKMTFNQNLINSSQAASGFYLEKQSQPTGDIVQTEFVVEDAFSADSSIIESWTEQWNYLDSIRLIKDYLDSARVESADSLMQELWAHKLDSLIVIEDSIRANIDFSATSYLFGKDSIIMAAKNLNDQISDTTLIVQNYRDFTDSYLSTVGSDTFGFTRTQVANLLRIAFQCPTKGGEPVFLARSLLSLSIDTVYFDELYCAQPSLKRSEVSVTPRVDSSLVIKLYPNPANNYAILQLSDPVEELFQLSIIDALGKMVFNQNILTVAGLYELNTKDLISGVYYVNLQRQGKVLYRGKLVVFNRR